MQRHRGELVVLTSSAGASVLIMFLLWQVVEEGWGHTVELRNAMHIARGVSASLVTAGVVALISSHFRRQRTDLLERIIEQRTAEATRTSRLLGLVFDHTPASLVLVDAAGTVVLANRTAERIHPGPLVGQPCRTTLDPSCNRCEVCPGRDALDTGHSAISPAQYTTPDSNEILELEAHPIELREGERHILLVERIVTEQRKLEASVLHQEKMAAFGLIAAGVAHEMGNPLSSLEMHLQLLDVDAMSEQDADSIRTVRQETARLRRTLRELVDFARRRRDEETLVSASSVVNDTLKLLSYDRRMRKVEVRADHDPETPPIYMVEDHLMQVVLNLVINSLDAMPNGGRLRIDTRTIGDVVSIRVRDTGTGMARSQLERSFEPLYTTKEAGRGTGLGLSICRDVIERAGGAIELHSSPGQGTTVIVTLPRASEQPARRRRTSVRMRAVSGPMAVS